MSEFGDPRLPERFWEKVAQQESGCWLWTRALNRDGYGTYWVTRTDRRLAHRYAFEVLVRSVPRHLEIDHWKHCSRACVFPGHLQPVTHQENAENRIAVWASSGYRNVYWDKANNKWLVTVKRDQRQIHVGRFTDVEEANAAAVAARLAIHTNNLRDRNYERGYQPEVGQ